MKTVPDRRVYNCYGYCANVSSELLGFCGYPQDPITLCHFLGNGYRAYSPGLMRFLFSDDASPFGEGGINSYCYCGGDPINRIDSSGRSWHGALTFKRVKAQADFEVFDTKMLRYFNRKVKVAKLSPVFKNELKNTRSAELDAASFGEISALVDYRSIQNAKRAYLLMADGSQPSPEPRGMFSSHYGMIISARRKLENSLSPIETPAGNGRALRRAHDENIKAFNIVADKARLLRDVQGLELSRKRC
ncbi:RHS repeat-associated core domain-containing protein [Pseudomonas sp. KCJK9044]|uniref:RHS repeat-associated core domain-containing protein n=1 Tax=Pseudomonas sp. KCJK9044 TaxID=3344562 RepID=UPI003905C7F8